MKATSRNRIASDYSHLTGKETSRFIDKIFYKSAEKMVDIPDAVVDLAITSPPYFNIKDYSFDGHQSQQHSDCMEGDIGAEDAYEEYITRLLVVWKECARVLKPNGKLCVNAPLMPMPKSQLNTHYNRHIYDLHGDIQRSILKDTELFLMDIYIWKRSNPSKRLMFGSYPYPGNFYAQNTSEFIAVYVKDGQPKNGASKQQREDSRLTQKEWLDYTQQIWTIPIPGRDDLAFGAHPAIMPEEIARRCIRMYSFKGGLVLDPFSGSGTTLKVAKATGRHYVGYEIYTAYRELIDAKLNSIEGDLFDTSNK